MAKWRTIRREDKSTKAHRSENATFTWVREQAEDGEYRVEVLEGTRWRWFCDARKTNGTTEID